MPKQLPIVRSLAEADPAYASALELRSSLRGKMSTLDAEENRLLYRLENAPPLENATNARVATLLGETQEADDGPLSATRTRLSQLSLERADLRTAIQIAEQRLAAARHGASAVICREVAGAYGGLVRTLADRLIAAHEAHKELLSLIDKLNDVDAAWTGHLPPMQANNILGDRGGKVERWLQGAASAGFIKKTDIPKELQV